VERIDLEAEVALSRDVIKRALAQLATYRSVWPTWPKVRCVLGLRALSWCRPTWRIWRHVRCVLILAGIPGA